MKGEGQERAVGEPRTFHEAASHASGDLGCREHVPGLELRFLTADQVTMIDELLASVRPYGEVCLTVSRRKLRFIACTQNHPVDAGPG